MENSTENRYKKETQILSEDTVNIFVVGENQNYVFSANRITVGRDKDEVDLCTFHPAISRIHAIFEFDETNWYIVDNKSSNGTYLNGLKLVPLKKYQLKPNDKIGLGSQGQETLVFMKDSNSALKTQEELFENIKKYIGQTYKTNTTSNDDPTSVGQANLEIMLGSMEETFQDFLFRKIDEKGMTDSQCYRKANIDRKVFSKIRNNPGYKTSKQTAILLAIALELDLSDTVKLLEKAGYALSHSNKFDIVIEYFIDNKKYDVDEIDNTLSDLGLPLLYK